MSTITETPATEEVDEPDIDPELKKIVLDNDLLEGKDFELTDASEAAPISDAGLEMATRSFLHQEMLLFSHSRIIDSAAASLDAAQANFNRISARMNFATEAEFNARMAEYLPRLEAAEDEALTTMQEVESQARAIVEATTLSGEPQLSADQMSAANNFRAFIKEDCETLTLAELSIKLQKAIASGDPVQGWLYARYGQPRVLAPIQESPYQREDGSTAYRVTPAMREAQQQCQAMIKHLASRLVDSRVPKIQAQAKEIIDRTRQFSREATARRSQSELQRLRTSSSYNMM